MKKSRLYIISIILLFVNSACSAKENSHNDLSSVLNLAINSPKLELYYHADQLPERKPLKVLHEISNDEVENIKLIKFGLPVELLKNNNTKVNNIYLIFSNVNIDKNKASLNFSYPVEGVMGKFELIKLNEKWSIKKTYLYEK